MTGKKKKESGEKVTGLMPGAILMIGLAIFWLPPFPCSGMDALTCAEMEALSGKSGITMAFGSPATIMKMTFNSLTPVPGDPDGIGINSNPGYLYFIGTGANTGTIGIEVDCGARLTFDVDTATSSGDGYCYPAGGAPYAGIKIPAGKTFFNFTLSSFSLALDNPDTVWIVVSDHLHTAGDDWNNVDSDQTDDDMDLVGWMRPRGLKIEKTSETSACYIWAHD